MDCQKEKSQRKPLDQVQELGFILPELQWRVQNQEPETIRMIHLMFI